MTLLSHDHSGLMLSSPVPFGLCATSAFVPILMEHTILSPCEPLVLQSSTGEHLTGLRLQLRIGYCYCSPTVIYTDRVLSSIFSANCSMAPCTTSSETLHHWKSVPPVTLGKQPEHSSCNVSPGSSILWFALVIHPQSQCSSFLLGNPLVLAYDPHTFPHL